MPRAITEVERVREVYARRMTAVGPARYTPFDPAHLLLHHSRQRAFLDILKRCHITTLRGLRILDIGCGACDILLEYLGYGAKPSDLFGIDILNHELEEGHERSPKLNLACADVGNLPFSDDVFDLVTQYTVFTSVLDDLFRHRIAAEMLRVVKPGGIILSYDFWPNNPANPDVRGLSVHDLELLFPGSKFLTKRIVLAPPISRRLARISPTACYVLERVPWLCSHDLVAIIPAKRSLVQRDTPTSREGMPS